MLINRNALRAPDTRAQVKLPLAHGAVLTVRPLDSFEHKLVVSEARAELNAMLTGARTQRVWASIPKTRIAAVKASAEDEMALLTWMHAVLLATASAVSLDGVVEIDDAEAARLKEIDTRLAEIAAALDALADEDAAPLERERASLDAERRSIGVVLGASFETFELLFSDAETEAAFKRQAYKIERLWSAEKNVSRPGPNGSGPEASTSAPPAATPATPAPAAESAAPPPAAGSAPTAPTPPTPPKASSPGPSPDRAGSGTSRA